MREIPVAVHGQLVVHVGEMSVISGLNAGIVKAIQKVAEVLLLILIEERLTWGWTGRSEWRKADTTERGQVICESCQHIAEWL